MTPSPYGSAAPDEDARALDAVEELAREAALADARLAVDREQVRAPVAQACGRTCSRGARARSRARRAERAGRAVAPGPSSMSTTRQARSGRVDALELERPGVLDDEASRPRADTRSARRGSRRDARPAGAARRGSRPRPWRTSSPRSSTTTSPASIPMRASSSSSSTAVAHRERRSGGTLRRRPRAPAGRRTPPARRRRRTSRRSRRAASTQCETVSKNSVTRRRTTSGSAPVTMPVEFDDVDEQDRRELALHA